MANVRVQLRRSLANAPSVGRWEVYTGACFTTSDPVPSADVRTLLARLFGGTDAEDNLAARWTTNEAFDLGSNRAQLSVWSWQGSWVTESVEPMTLERQLHNAGTFWSFPGQLGVAVGYRADLGSGVPRQRGRSRWRVGPLVMNAAYVTGGGETGGVRLSPSGCDLVVANAVSCLNALATEGWQLMVKSGSTNYTFSPAVEMYVDDVFDVQRSRRPWSNYQERVDL